MCVMEERFVYANKFELKMLHAIHTYTYIYLQPEVIKYENGVT